MIELLYKKNNEKWAYPSGLKLSKSIPYKYDILNWVQNIVIKVCCKYANCFTGLLSRLFVHNNIIGTNIQRKFARSGPNNLHTETH